ncbi:MAG: O-antigen ligase family protein [Gammaproteobacteria bacterium]|nr:O-antigen ligase family protein [Gammaproteobacteria bacterium]
MREKNKLSLNSDFIKHASFMGLGFLIIFPFSVTSSSGIHGAIVFLSLIFALIFYLSSGADCAISNEEYLLFFSVVFMVLVALFVTACAGIDELAMKKLFKFLYLLMIVPVYIFFRKIRVNHTAFWCGLVVGAIVSGFVALYELWPGLIQLRFFRRASGGLNPIIFGDISLLLGAMSMAGIGWFKSKANWLIILPVVAFVLGLLASVLSNTQGAWLAIPFICLVFIWYSSCCISRWKLVLGLLILLGIMLVVYLTPMTGVASKLERTTHNLQIYYNSPITSQYRDTPIGARLEAWQASWQIFLDNPLIGVGWGRYNDHAKVLVEKGLRNEVAIDFMHPHNQFFSSLVSGGLLGLSATLVLFVVPILIFIRVIKSVDKSDDMHRIALAGLVMVIGFAVCNLTESFLERSRPVSFFLFYLAVCMAGIRIKDSAMIQLSEKS